LTGAAGAPVRDRRRTAGDRPGDTELCAAARATLAKTVDWPCDVVWDLSDANLGCGRRVATGLDRVFGHVEAAIVLEDDCVPADSVRRWAAHPAIALSCIRPGIRLSFT
jgi:hypothetical protein